MLCLGNSQIGLPDRAILLEHIDRVLPAAGLYLIVAWRTLFVPPGS